MYFKNVYKRYVFHTYTLMDELIGNLTGKKTLNAKNTNHTNYLKKFLLHIFLRVLTL